MQIKENTTPKLISKERLAELSKLSPLIGYRDLAFDWATIIACIVLSENTQSLLVSLLAILLIGSRQNSLAVQAHDGAHYRVHPNSRKNDVVTEILMAWPLFSSIEKYRQDHKKHHLNLNTAEDPDWIRNKAYCLERGSSVREKIRLILSIEIGLKSLRRFMGMGAVPSQRKSHVKELERYAFYMISAMLITLTSSWHGFIVYWILPFLLYLVPILRLRGITDHWALENSCVYSKTRTILCSPLVAKFIYPKNINYHLAHHLFPSIPYYNLRLAQAEIIKNNDLRRLAQTDNSLSVAIRNIINY